MRVLVACEFSGVVSQAFRDKGHTAISCDLLENELTGSQFHHQGDVREILDRDWDLLIAHPPCTYLCNSDVRWLYTDPDRWEKMEEARIFFLDLLESGIERICIENPIPHSHARLPKYSQIIQPWQFGHGETKATCLWLENLPLLRPTKIVDGREPKVHYASPSKDRWKERSRTYQGIADAMAEQWSF